MENEVVAQAEVETVAVATQSNAGRKQRYADSENILADLVAIRDNDTENMPSKVLQAQLMERNLLAYEVVKTGKPGRPSYEFHLTGAAKSLIPLLTRSYANRDVKAAKVALVEAEKAEVMAMIALEKATAATKEAELTLATAIANVPVPKSKAVEVETE